MSSKAFQNADKLNGIVSVLEFGARGDGVTDDTAAIQAALNAVDAAGGGSVYIPATSSFYNLTSVLLIGSNTTLYGDGMDASRLKWSTLPPTVITGDFSGASGRRAILNKNYTLSGTQNTSISIRDLKVDLSLIVGALGNARQAIFFFNCTFTSVRNCHVLSDGGCILNVKVTNYIVDSNYCEQVGTYASSDGMIDQWWGSQNGIISNNYVDGKLLCKYAILLNASDTTGGAGGTMSNIKFLGNTVKNAGRMGFWVEGRIDTAQLIEICNNTIDTCGPAPDNTGYGIRVLSCNDVIVSGNHILNCYGFGIELSAAQGQPWTRNGENYVVSSNTIKNVGLRRTTGSLTDVSAIRVYYTNRVQVTDNQITPLSTALYLYAIEVDNVSSNLIISENVLSAGINANAIYFGTNQAIKIYRNFGFVTEAFGQATILSGTSSIVVTGLNINFNPAEPNSPFFIAIAPLNIASNMASLGAPIVANWTQTQFEVRVATNATSNFVFRWSIVRL